MCLKFVSGCEIQAMITRNKLDPRSETKRQATSGSKSVTLHDRAMASKTKNDGNSKVRKTVKWPWKPFQVAVGGMES
jgi:hypothetical protein